MATLTHTPALDGTPVTVCGIDFWTAPGELAFALGRNRPTCPDCADDDREAVLF